MKFFKRNSDKYYPPPGSPEHIRLREERLRKKEEERRKAKEEWYAQLSPEEKKKVEERRQRRREAKQQRKQQRSKRREREERQQQAHARQRAEQKIRENLLYSKDRKVGYDKYIKSPIWERRKRELFERLSAVEPECEVCRSTQTIQVHHNTYENIYTREKNRDLIILCQDCHHQFHSNRKLYTGITQVAKDKAYTKARCSMCSYWKTTHKLTNGPYRDVHFCEECYNTFKDKMLDKNFIVTIRGGGLGIIRGEVPLGSESPKARKTTMVRRRRRSASLRGIKK